jgi:hypothetical protein
MAIRFKNLIDWSSKNILAAGLADTMCICNVDFKHLSKVYRIDHTSYLCCLKWNIEGTSREVIFNFQTFLMFPK